MNSNSCPRITRVYLKKVPKTHPRRRYIIAMKYYGNKRGSIQLMSDWEAALAVGKKFGYGGQFIYQRYWGDYYYDIHRFPGRNNHA